jgi:hypothetical protein
MDKTTAVSAAVTGASLAYGATRDRSDRNIITSLHAELYRAGRKPRGRYRSRLTATALIFFCAPFAGFYVNKETGRNILALIGLPVTGFFLSIWYVFAGGTLGMLFWSFVLVIVSFACWVVAAFKIGEAVEINNELVGCMAFDDVEDL